VQHPLPYNSGFLFSGALSDAEKAPVDFEIGSQKKGGLQAGDTIEQHYVHTTAVITPGPTLGSCLAESIMNPQLRVEAVVFVIVNDENAGDMVELNKVEMVNGYWQAPNLPAMLGDPVQYAGSTTGPAYNEKGSPLQVSWSVRPRVMKVSASSVAKWLEGNEFDEIKAHAVRNLVLNSFQNPTRRAHIYAPRHGLRATRSISTNAPTAKAVTPTQVRAGSFPSSKKL